MPELFKNQDPLVPILGTEWHFTYIENGDLYICERGKIEQAYLTAPNSVVRGYVYGIYESRQRAANLTGNNF